METSESEQLKPQIVVDRIYSQPALMDMINSFGSLGNVIEFLGNCHTVCKYHLLQSLLAIQFKNLP